MIIPRYKTEAIESKIQRMLLNFVNEHGCTIDHVRVNTRNFAVEILLKEQK